MWDFPTQNRAKEDGLRLHRPQEKPKLECPWSAVAVHGISATSYCHPSSPMSYACDAKTVLGLAEKAVAQTATSSRGAKRIILVKRESVSVTTLARPDTG